MAYCYHLLERLNNVKINYRGNVVKIDGNKKAIEETKLTLEKLFNEAKKGVEIDEEKIKDTRSLISLEIKESSQLDFFIQTKIYNTFSNTFNFNHFTI